MFEVSCSRRQQRSAARFRQRQLLLTSWAALVAVLVLVPFLALGVGPSAAQTTPSTAPDTTSSSTTTTTPPTTTTTTTPGPPAMLSFQPPKGIAGATVGTTAQLSDPKVSGRCDLVVGAVTFADCAVADGRLVGWFTIPGIDPTGSVIGVTACLAGEAATGATVPCTAPIASGSITVVAATPATTTTSTTSTTTTTTTAPPTTTTTTVPAASSSGVPVYLVVIIVVVAALIAALLGLLLARRIRAWRSRRWFERHDSFRITSGAVSGGRARPGGGSGSAPPRTPGPSGRGGQT